MWLRTLAIQDLRNLREVELELDEGLNVLFGANAQGKTSVLEAVGLLARGRSFRTDESRQLIRRGSAGLRTRGTVVERDVATDIEVRLDQEQRILVLNGKRVRPGLYHGQLEVGVYSTDRLRAVRGSMRERRLFVDRTAAATWPAYRKLLRDYEKVVRQRSAALEGRRNGIEAWDEGLLELGARLRTRRQDYVEQLQARLSQAPALGDEEYAVLLSHRADTEQAHRELLSREIEQARDREERSGRTLVGPHRDRLRLTVNGHELAEGASAGQGRCLLLALTLASLDVYRQVRGGRPVALLDDLDSELDDQRATDLCRRLAPAWQLLVTTAHPSWARRLGEFGSTFEVNDGDVCHT